MKLLNTLRLLLSPTAPTAGATAGAVYYDSAQAQPLFNDGTTWAPFGVPGIPDPIVTTFTVPDGRQVMYFDHFQNDGVLIINGSGYLVGIR